MTSDIPKDGLVPAPEDEARKVPVSREEIAILNAPRGPIAEQFRSLRNSIHALNPDGASHTMVLTSAARGEGKTVSCLNLAFAMAELPGIEVLVLDADLHHPARSSGTTSSWPHRSWLRRAGTRPTRGMRR